MNSKKIKLIKPLPKNANSGQIVEKLFESMMTFFDIYDRDINIIHQAIKSLRKLVYTLILLTIALFVLIFKYELIMTIDWYWDQISSSLPKISADFKIQLLIVSPTSFLGGALITFYLDRKNKIINQNRLNKKN